MAERNNKKIIDEKIGIDDESIIHFERLNWKQIDGLNKNHCVFFLPISPLEEHGPHLPIGTDLITAKDATIETIKILSKKHPSYSCILLPSIPIGFAGFNTDFPGTISVSSRTVKEIVFQYGKMLAQNGFSKLIVCSYHMALGHLKGIHNALNKLRRSYQMNVCEPWSSIFYSDAINTHEPSVDIDTTTEIHGGFRETSLMKYTHPSLVDNNYKNLPTQFSDKISSPTIIFKTFKQIGLKDGYVGTPSKANKQYGKWFFEFTVQSYINAFELMIENKPLPDLPKKIKRQMLLLFWL